MTSASGNNRGKTKEQDLEALNQVFNPDDIKPLMDLTRELINEKWAARDCVVALSEMKGIYDMDETTFQVFREEAQGLRGIIKDLLNLIGKGFEGETK